MITLKVTIFVPVPVYTKHCCVPIYTTILLVTTVVFNSSSTFSINCNKMAGVNNNLVQNLQYTRASHYTLGIA